MITHISVAYRRTLCQAVCQGNRIISGYGTIVVTRFAIPDPGYADQNMGVLRHITLNRMRQRYEQGQDMGGVHEPHATTIICVPRCGSEECDYPGTHHKTWQSLCMDRLRSCRTCMCVLP